MVLILASSAPTSNAALSLGAKKIVQFYLCLSKFNEASRSSVALHHLYKLKPNGELALMGYDTEADSSTELTEPAGTSVKCAKCQTPAAEADRNIDPSELEELAKDQKYVCHKCKKAQGKMAVNGGLFTADGEKVGMIQQ